MNRLLRSIVSLDAWMLVGALSAAGATGWILRDADATRDAEFVDELKELNATTSKDYAHNEEALKLTRELRDHLRPKKSPEHDDNYPLRPFPAAAGEESR